MLRFSKACPGRVKKTYPSIAVPAVVFILALFQFPSAAHSQSESIWESLPAETFGALRLNVNTELMERMSTETKFGEVLFSEKKQEVFAKIAEQMVANADEGLTDGLARFGLEVDDWRYVIAGDSGLAVVEEPQQAPGASFFLVWLTPADEVSERLWEAFQKWVDELAEDDESFRVVEFDLDGMTAINVSRSKFIFENIVLDNELADEGTLVFDNAVLVNQNGRISIAASTNEVREDDLEDHTEWLGDKLSQILAGNAGDKSFPDVIADQMGDLFNPTSEEDTIVEAAGNISRLLDFMIRETPEDQHDEMNKMLGFFGVRDAESAVIRISFGEQLLRTYGFVSWPAPRTGLLRAFGNKNSAISPPAWIPASATTIRQMHLDVGHMFEVIEEEATRAFPEAQQGYDMARQQVDTMVGVSLDDLLSSLATTQYMVQFAPDISALVEDELEDSAVEPTALVWDVNDEGLWKRVMQAIAPFAPMANLEATEEQGFRGFRIQSPVAQGGFVLGQGKLILGLGPDTLESILSVINNPPSGKNAYRNSQVYEAAEDWVELRDATMTEITDGNRMVQLARDAFSVATMQLGAYEDNYGDEFENGKETMALKLLLELFPDEEEAEGMLGVVVTEYIIDEEGLTLHSVNELPAN